jgi:hypothetical protein
MPVQDICIWPFAGAEAFDEIVLVLFVGLSAEF